MSARQNIWFFSEDVSYVHKGKNATRSWINNAIFNEGFSFGEINIIFCSDEYLSQINLKYLNHNTLTDIVTFDMSEKEDVISGDVYISVERARENCKKFDVRLDDEIKRLIIHGILHLAGYSDKAPEDKALMTRKEDYYLSLPAS